jgi:hypothetical protein
LRHSQSIRKQHYHFPASNSAIERASAIDRAYFASHPGVSCYVRKRVPGEFPGKEGDPVLIHAQHVLVTQIRSGARIRQPFAALFKADYPTRQIPLEHIEALDTYLSEHGVEPSEVKVF